MYEAKGTPQAAFEFQRKELAEARVQGTARRLQQQARPTRGTSPRTASSSRSARRRSAIRREGRLVERDAGQFRQRGPGQAARAAGREAVSSAACARPRTRPTPRSPRPPPPAASCCSPPAGSPMARRASQSAGHVDAVLQAERDQAAVVGHRPTPAEGGKTLIRYDTELMSADLPAPPGTADPRYDDSQQEARLRLAARTRPTRSSRSIRSGCPSRAGRRRPSGRSSMHQQADAVPGLPQSAEGAALRSTWSSSPTSCASG